MKKILFILISIPFLFLVACTGETIIVMSKELENNFEPVAANIFPDCIDKVSSGISVRFTVKGIISSTSVTCLQRLQRK